jgi:hypothetical protein
MAGNISNSDRVIDSRDVIARIEELRQERDDYALWADPETRESDTPESRAAWAEENPDDADELAALEALADEAEGYGDWTHGEGLIHEDHWLDYVRELAEDIGAIDCNASWPLTCIDWKAAAEELEADYMTVEFDGVTYYMRA